MRKINLDTWPRCEHFRHFARMVYSHFGLCANVELTAFYLYVKKWDISFNIAIVYLLVRAANEIPEFRQRIRNGEVVEHEIVHPSTTVMASEDLFSFCPIPYSEAFSLFAPRAPIDLF
jgi:chloramphenicol O-acetyltransferase type A